MIADVNDPGVSGTRYLAELVSLETRDMLPILDQAKAAGICEIDDARLMRVIRRPGEAVWQAPSLFQSCISSGGLAMLLPFSVVCSLVLLGIACATARAKSPLGPMTSTRGT